MNYLKQYEYVSAIAEYGTITLAAEKLGIAQSALSRYLIKLEKGLGTTLFDRNIEPITLTQAGKCFLETGREMLALDREMKRQIHNLDGLGCIDIHLGIGITRAPYILPAVIKKFREFDKKTNIVVFELTTSEINRRLIKNELDFAISIYDDEIVSIQKIELLEEKILLCRKIGSKNNTPIYPGRGQALREIMQKVVEQNSVYSSNYIETQNTETAISLVKSDLGFTVVPSYFEEFSSGDGLEFIELDKTYDNRERKVSLMYRKDKILKEEEKLFIKCAKASLEK